MSLAICKPLRLGIMQLTNGIKSYVDLHNFSHPMLVKPLFEDLLNKRFMRMYKLVLVCLFKPLIIMLWHSVCVLLCTCVCVFVCVYECARVCVFCRKCVWPE